MDLWQSQSPARKFHHYIESWYFSLWLHFSECSIYQHILIPNGNHPQANLNNRVQPVRPLSVKPNSPSSSCELERKRQAPCKLSSDLHICPASKINIKEVINKINNNIMTFCHPLQTNKRLADGVSLRTDIEGLHGLFQKWKSGRMTG